MTKAGVIRLLNQATAGRDIIVTTGVGSHQQIVAREFTWDYPWRMLITSAGHGTMGFGLPAAIGAAIERPDVPVLCINGDGSACMDMPNLVTLGERRLNIRVVILDDESYGIVRQFEELQGYKTLTTAWLKNPEFAEIAKACAVWASGPTETRGWGVEQWAGFILGNGPKLAHVLVEDHAVWPILEGGKLEMTHG